MMMEHLPHPHYIADFSVSIGKPQEEYHFTHRLSHWLQVGWLHNYRLSLLFSHNILLKAFQTLCREGGWFDSCCNAARICQPIHQRYLRVTRCPALYVTILQAHWSVVRSCCKILPGFPNILTQSYLARATGSCTIFPSAATLALTEKLLYKISRLTGRVTV